MSARAVPRDNQVGDPLGGPIRFVPEPRPVPRSVTCIGVGRPEFLYRAVLWDVFGVPNVALRKKAEIGEPPPRRGAVIVGAEAAPVMSWKAFVEWLGERNAVIDLQAAIRMAALDGCALEPGWEPGSGERTETVFLHNMEAPIFPDAPRIRVVDSVCFPGFSHGDECHFYHRGPDGDVGLRRLRVDDRFKRFLSAWGGRVWAVGAQSGDAAIIVFSTRLGGRITLLDLDAVNRLPEASGVEGVAIQILLNALGVGSSIFGKFLRAIPDYEEFVERVRALVAKYPGCAGMERIGRSTKNRDMWILKLGIGENDRAVLFSTAIHSLEWGPTYGMLRLVRFLLHECSEKSAYAGEVLGSHSLWWVLCANPDGWETRDQEALGVNLNRNFPGPAWENRTGEGLRWDAYNKRFSAMQLGDFKAWGTAPGSEAETRTLMDLLRRERKGIVVLADFHETTAPCSFYHQYETPDGAIPDMAYHRELIQDACAVSNGRFWSNANVMAYGDALSDPTTYQVREFVHLDRLLPTSIAGWQSYAAASGLRAPLVEAAGCDCTHYQTIRRTEYAALIAEQILAAEEGRLLRNPLGEERKVKLNIRRNVASATCRIYDAAGALIEESCEARPKRVVRVIPPGGRLRLQYT